MSAIAPEALMQACQFPLASSEGSVPVVCPFLALLLSSDSAADTIFFFIQWANASVLVALVLHQSDVWMMDPFCC